MRGWSHGDRLDKGRSTRGPGVCRVFADRRPKAQKPALRAGLQRLLATDATPVRLVMRAEGLELVAIAQEVGQAHEALDAKYEGAELTVAFNPEYLIAGIEVTPGDEVTLETTDAMKPALLRSIDSNDFLYLLMPVRVS